MGKGFGIAAMIVVVISFFIPFVGFLGTGVAMVLATVAALAGDRVFATVTSLVGAVSTFFFSPTMWLMMAAPDSPTGGKTTFFIIVVGVLALPIVGMLLHSSGKLALGQSSQE